MVALPVKFSLLSLTVTVTVPMLSLSTVQAESYSSAGTTKLPAITTVTFGLVAVSGTLVLSRTIVALLILFFAIVTSTGVAEMTVS